MRKKFTMLLMSLLAFVGVAKAENVLFNASHSTAPLPGTLTDGQYHWKSSEMTAPENFKTLRLTFVENTNGERPAGYPCITLAEFYLYDKDGNQVSLAEANFSSNATEANEGSIAKLCDGFTTRQDGEGEWSWYWHSAWSSNVGAYHYLEINVSDIEADLSTFTFGYVTRRSQASPKEIVVTTGSSTEDVAAQCPTVTLTYNHKINGVTKRTDEFKTVLGASMPSVSALPAGVKLNTELPTVVTEGKAYDLEIAYDGSLPFTPSENFETANWHYLKFTKAASYIRYHEADTYIPSEEITKLYPSVDPEAYAWAFVGDPYAGVYKLMNRKAGSTKVLSSPRNIYDGNTGGNTCPLMKTESEINESTDNKTWIIENSNNISDVKGMYIGLTTSNNETKFMNSRGKLAFWTGGRGDGSTFWTEKFSYVPAFVVAKEEALKSLNALAAIASDKTAEACSAIEALNPTTEEDALAAFATLNEKMDAVVEGEYFTLCNKNNTSIYLTTDGTNASATTTVDIKAYWTLKNKNGLFYLYNRYNNAYLQAVPTTGETKITITDKENHAYAYKAVTPTSDNKVWALSTFIGANNGDQRFLHKAGDNRIVRWTASDASSQWTIAEVDYAAAFSALIEAQLEGKVFSDNPALGEYPTSAKNDFDALKAAYIANPTEENELALVNGVAGLDKAKNRPVFTIDGVISYAAGKSIYENNEGALKFKQTDNYDKTMWWAFDMNSTEVSTQDRVVVSNVATGKNFWGSEYISVIETDPANETDGIFMFKTNGTGSTIHAQNSGQTIVRYEDANAKQPNGGSAWKFTYIGNTYDLNKLTDKHLEVAAALKVVYDKYASYEDDEFSYNATPALGQYAVNATGFKATLAIVKQFANASVSDLAKAEVTVMAEAAETLETEAEELFASKNMPVYIIKSAWDGGYSAGSAIYYDGAWKWKKANRYDRQMWMTIPNHTATEAPFVDTYDANGASYEVCDYLTGTVMRGKSVQFVQVPNWEGVYSLQYNADSENLDAAQHAKSDGTLVNWKTALINDRQASAWEVEYLGNTYDLKDLTDEQLSALTEVQAAFDSKIYLYNATFGNGVGQYQGAEGSEDAIKSTLMEVNTYLYRNLSVFADASVEDINALRTMLDGMPAVTLNMPTEGFYRIYGANNNITPAGQYITGHTNWDNGRIALTQEADASTIYYYKDGKLLAYESGKYIGLSSNHFVFANETHPASDIKFATSSYITGAYTIKSANRYLHYKVHNDAVEIDRCETEESANDSWYLQKVTSLPVTVSEVGYSSFYTPVDMEIPIGVTANIIKTVSDNEATLVPVTGIIPASTGLILEANEGSYEFAIAEGEPTADVEGNLLTGSTAKTLVEAEAGFNYYALANKNGKVALYKATLNKNADGSAATENGTHFINNANKAYLPIKITSEAFAPAMFSFGRGEGTTSIDNAQLTIDNATIIYDLTGRRVEKMEKGIYIVNGRKVVIK